MINIIYNNLLIMICTLFISTSIICIICLIGGLKHIMNSLICFALMFFLVSIYLFIQGITFLGFIYLIIYIGAICCLFLITIMIMNPKITVNKPNFEILKIISLVVCYLPTCTFI